MGRVRRVVGRRQDSSSPDGDAAIVLCAVCAEHSCARQLKVGQQRGLLTNKCQPPQLKTAPQQYQLQPVPLVLQEAGLTVLLPAHIEG